MPALDDRNATVRRTGAISLESAARQQCSRHNSQRASRPAAGVFSRHAHSACSSVTAFRNLAGVSTVDLIFILGVLALYAVTHVLILAVARLQSAQ
jgi:hypothetical protein